MPLIDSTTGNTIRDYTIDALRERAGYMRGLNLISLCAAGSGHSGGTLSVMDIAAALYLKVARHDPHKPDWEDRDRIIWSAGHKAPALYAALAVSDYFDEKELVRLRQLGSPFQGHPHRFELPGVEFSTGSLGQGLSLGVGVALAARLDNRTSHTFVICSDGEQQEGSIWEAAMSAAHFKLGNLTAIVDFNGLQIDGLVADVMSIEPLAEKYRAFGWEVVNVDGHNMAELVEALERASTRRLEGQPLAVICHTVKGRGVSFMENVIGWHGKPPNRRELDLALAELGVEKAFDVDRMLSYADECESRIESRLAAETPRLSRDYWWNRSDGMRVEMEPTRKGFGRALDEHGDDPRIVCIGADISDSICISDFYKNHPERRSRFISVGIAEQNATTIAAGLAREGKIPVFGTYGVFASARNLDQIRVSVCYANLNVLVVGAHGGISVGPDGATHQELESMFQIAGLPNMHLATPCDAIETEKMTEALLFEITGPKYLRFAREATPVITEPETPFRFGEALVFRFRREAGRFADAFEAFPASEYKNECEVATIISCGPETAEALRAAYILKSELNIETRVLHFHTIKPLDGGAIIRAAGETGCVVTAEEHQVGGLGFRVAAAMAEKWTSLPTPPGFGMIGIPDRFGESGRPWQLMRHFGLTAEYIAAKVREVLQAD
ncbi:MAG: transketolase [candidate division Zixibacteria bacterium]|nr:transketolase [candidate division Zixibacteria bacterium]